MTGNRVVVHKRNQNPSPIDQLGTTIPMAELFAPPDPNPAPPRAKPDRPARLVPVPMEQADLVGDMPQASLAARTIHAVVFDLEGTLLDIAGWRRRSLENALARFGHAPGHDKDHPWDARSCRSTLEQLSHDQGFPRGLHAAVERLESVLSIHERSTALRPGFAKEYLLVRLRREGYRLVACSRTDAPAARAALDASGLLPWFESVVSEDDVTERKPSPEIFLSICDQLGLRPKQVLAIESEPQGIEAARLAGIHLCRVTDREQAEWPRISPVLEQLATRSPGIHSC
jgi:beta-phosphoglucomutase